MEFRVPNFLVPSFRVPSFRVQTAKGILKYKSTQTMQEMGDIINNYNTSNLRHTVPVRAETKAAKSKRLYRERHREEINRRNRENWKRRRLHQIQQQNYERCEKEISKCKRDSRLKLNGRNRKTKNDRVQTTGAALRTTECQNFNSYKLVMEQNDCSLNQSNLLEIKEESGDVDVDIGPTVLQHMDSHYRCKQQDESVVKAENEIDDVADANRLTNADDATLHSGVMQDFNKIELISVDGLGCAAAVSTLGGTGSGKQAGRFIVESTSLVLVPVVLLPCYVAINQDTKVGKADNMIAEAKNTVDKADNMIAEAKNMIDKAESTVVEVENMVVKMAENTVVEADNTIVEAENTIIVAENMVVKAKNVVACGDSNLFMLGRDQNENIEAKIKLMCTTSFYKCHQCEKLFVRKGNLAKHVAKVHGAPGELEYRKPENLEDCNICGASLKFTTHGSHMESVHSNEQLQCKVCGEIIMSTYFYQHTWLPPAVTVPDLFNNATPLEEQARYDVRSCGKCLEIFTSEKSFKYHCIRKHSAKTRKQIERNEKLSLESNTRDGVTQYTCTVCKKMYKTDEFFREHISDCYGRSTTDPGHSIYYICDNCGKQCMEKGQIADHMLSEHADLSHKCNLCKKLMYCKTYIVRHMLRKHITFMNKCNVCGDSVNLRKMRDHMITMHGGMKPQCKVCGKIMRSKWQLYTHMNAFHGQWAGGPRTYTCDHCQKSFGTKVILRVHIEGVHGEGIYECQKCYKIFKCKTYLLQHNRTVHSGQRHECETCDRVFRDKYAVKRHVKKFHALNNAESKSELRTCEIYDVHPVAGDTSAMVDTGMQQHNLVPVKEEPADEELELGPVVFQHMDFNYRPLNKIPQPDTSILRQYLSRVK